MNVLLLSQWCSMLFLSDTLRYVLHVNIVSGNVKYLCIDAHYFSHTENCFKFYNILRTSDFYKHVNCFVNYMLYRYVHSLSLTFLLCSYLFKFHCMGFVTSFKVPITFFMFLFLIIIMREQANSCVNWQRYLTVLNVKKQ